MKQVDEGDRRPTYPAGGRTSRKRRGMKLVGIDDVRASQRLLFGVSIVTPLVNSLVLRDLVGGPVFLKCENMQRGGSFKIRGAYVRMARLTPVELRRGVVAASAGNHAQGVAIAAGLLDTPARIFMPIGASLPKIEATRSYGAAVELIGRSVDEALQAARTYSTEHGSILIHPCDHADIIAGQGTVGLEILEQCPDVRTVLVGTGGGGICSGIAVALKAIRPDAQIFGVQAEAAAAFPMSLGAGHPVTLTSMATMADGIAVGRPGDVTFAHVRSLVDEIVTVSEASLTRALLLCLERSKLVVEPAGVASVAALMDAPERFEPPVVAVLTGGNIDPALLSKVILSGMVDAGRFLSCRLRLPDRPGDLAALLQLVAAEGANVLNIEHSRTGSQLGLDEVELALSVETRGRTHGEQILAALNGTGGTHIRRGP